MSFHRYILALRLAVGTCTACGPGRAGRKHVRLPRDAAGGDTEDPDRYRSRYKGPRHRSVSEYQSPSPSPRHRGVRFTISVWLLFVCELVCGRGGYGEVGPCGSPHVVCVPVR